MRQHFGESAELAGIANEDPNNPLIRAFYETLSAREELLREKHSGKHIKSLKTIKPSVKIKRAR
jgi:hypothetical protein